ncbi:uncharacterized protein LOC143534677 [Bidens hawaiensis]|uniref:uncharacterized protein LOC143534677 n=1 Tax=Bidens hawaiensis TaxID=980011 RepID=UPI00404AEE5E
MAIIVDDSEKVLLNEGEVQPKKHISTEESLWYLDNGVSNHMTGVRSHFKEINEAISGRVRFGDGSYVEIKGRGSILFECKNQEQMIIFDVYCISNLKNNMLSLGQLTEIRCKVVMEGNRLLIYNHRRNLLFKVERSKNMLYNVRLKISTPACLLANIDDEAWMWHTRLGHLNFDSIKDMT